MDTLIMLTLILALIPITLTLILIKHKQPSKNHPPGSLGIPYIGQSLALLRAMRTNRDREWLQQRIEKYGPVSKLNLFGCPTVLLAGPVGNKFVFMNEGNVLGNHQPRSFTRILGDRIIIELVGEEHRRLRGAIGGFMRPEVLKRSVGRMDEEVRLHLDMFWRGKSQVKVSPLMKTLTFDMICSLLFGLERGHRRSELVNGFEQLIAGLWSIPVNLPFTQFGKSLRASRRIRSIVTSIVHEKRTALAGGGREPSNDVITSLLSFGLEEGPGTLTEEEVVDNVMFLMVAGYDTTSILITFLIRQLSRDLDVYDKVLREQEGIAKNKAPGERLTWEDLSKMKYTWRVAMEVSRIVPPAFGSMRRVLKDIEYKGYQIPKGWQIFWAATVTQMDEHIFPEPTKFDPSRFESQSPCPPPPFSYIPFGGGPRICPGYEFAKCETLVVIHHVVTGFKWNLCAKEDSFIRNPVPEPYEGLPIQIDARH
ncbi:Cytochrome P450 [Acorus gramineus]|uniref:Cytochrome P450 n=1 Tax=Acorus gramineus TaxID=55184 RepID=A0AAV9BUN0_ACOGR|nr:Cytochrome P450 [Acorus gramineus]